MLIKDEIHEYGSFDDRADPFDDRTELSTFVSFLQKHYGDIYTIVEKPFGPYAVDLGLFDRSGVVVAAFDLERCKSWGDDWPKYWKSLSFLARKDKHLEYRNFGMVWFNNALDKFIIAWKDDIKRFPVTKRTFKGKSYHDLVRKVDFQYGTLFGSSFNQREAMLFQNRVRWAR